MADSVFSRLARAVEALATPSDAATPIARLVPLEKRLIGFNAGLPQGGLGDVSGSKMTGAIPLRGEAPTEYQRTGTTIRIRGFERHPVVSACVHAIVDIASAVPLQVYKKTPEKNASGFGDAIAVQTSSNPLQMLLDAPNSFMSAQRYRALVLTHYLIYGNTIQFLERPVAPEGASDAYVPKPPRALRVVHPEDIMSVYVNAKGYPLWYVWRDILGYTHTSPVQDMLHVRDLSAKGLVFGYPRAASALNDIIGDDEASQFVRQTVTNSGQAGVWLLANDETTVEEAARVDSLLYEKFVTRGERGRTTVMGGIKDIKTVAFSLKDLEFPDLRRVAREDICAAFGVDPRMVGITSAQKDAGLSGGQYTEARVRLIKQTIEPLMRAFESEMNLWLAPEFGDVYVRFDPDSLAALAEDKEATSKRMIAETGAGLRTVEEAREVLELAPEFDDDDLLALTLGVSLTPVAIAMAPPQPLVTTLDATGKPIATPPPTPPSASDTPNADKAVTPTDAGTTSTPSKTDASEDASTKIDTSENPNDPSKKANITDGNKDPEPKSRAVIRAAKHHARLVRNGTRTWARGVVLSPDDRTMLWSQFDRRARNEEAPFKRAALLLFGEERSAVAKLFAHHDAQAEGATDTKLAEHIGAAKRAVKRMYSAKGEVTARWVDRFHPLIGGVYAKGGTKIAAAIKKSFAPPRRAGATANLDHTVAEPVIWNVNNPNVEAAIRERARRLAEHVGATTSQDIYDALELGLRDGMTLDEIARLVDRTAFGGRAGQRAELIARTETIGALNQGELDAAKDSGVVAGKEWLTQGDDRVRDSHFECESEGMIGVDEAFETNGMQYPGDPDGDAEEVINCRCTLLYYDTLEDGASSIEGAGAEMSTPVVPVTRRIITISHDKSTNALVGEITTSP
jgi:HK97 family phage portal protein